MTKKDFKLIATVLANSNLEWFAKRGLAKDFAAELTKTNPSFNCERFIDEATDVK